MLLSNLSATSEGQRHLAGLDGDAKVKFVIVESIFGMACYFSKNKAFDFASNVMANLACQEEVRQFMVEQKFIEAIVVQIVTKYLPAHRRKYLMQCLRNLLFEYSSFEDKFLLMNVPRDVCKVLIDEQGITADKLGEEWRQWGAKQVKREEEVDLENSASMVESLVLLANSDKLAERMS
jgi:Domain of unknown function (DUF383)